MLLVRGKHRIQSLSMANERKRIARTDRSKFSLHFNERAIDEYYRERYTDCTFFIEDAAKHEKKVFQCKKLMLSLASPKFEAMLSSSETAKGPDDAIIISGVSSQCFDIAMRFIYGKKVEKLSNLNLAMELAYFALQWQIKYLADIAVAQFNLFEFSGGKLFQFYLICKLIGDKVKTSEYFQKFFIQKKEFFTYTEWLDAEQSTILGVLSNDRQCFHNLCEEEDLLLGILAWGKHRVLRRGFEVSAEVIRAELIDLLPLIRFRLFSATTFNRLSEMECCSILSDTEKIAISNCLMSGDASDMPPGFSCSLRKDQKYLRDDSEDEARSHFTAEMKAIAVESTIVQVDTLLNSFATFNEWPSSYNK